MKWIKYNLLTKTSYERNLGTEDVPVWETVEVEILSPVSLSWNETNEEIAKKEAYNGEYTIEDDGMEEAPSVQEDTDSMLIDHEYRLTLLELGITEEV